MVLLLHCSAVCLFEFAKLTFFSSLVSCSGTRQSCLGVTDQRAASSYRCTQIRLLDCEKRGVHSVWDGLAEELRQALSGVCTLFDLLCDGWIVVKC